MLRSTLLSAFALLALPMAVLAQAPSTAGRQMATTCTCADYDTSGYALSSSSSDSSAGMTTCRYPSDIDGDVDDSYSCTYDDSNGALQSDDNVDACPSTISCSYQRRAAKYRREDNFTALQRRRRRRVAAAPATSMPNFAAREMMKDRMRTRKILKRRARGE